MMNELQRRELDIFKTCLDICEKLNIRYYLVCGSALGAAKYQGFIPWDDDMDVGMPRSDYEVFLKEAPALLPEGIFLQNFRTDSAFFHIFSKLRDSNTTLIEKGIEHLPIHHGVYIDIFPLDGYPESTFERVVFEWKKKVFSWKIYCAILETKNLKVRVRNQLFRILGYHKRTAKTLMKLEKLYKKYPAESSEWWCNHGNWQRKLEYAHRSQYGNGKQTFFEGVPVIIPEKFDEYLTQKYGDWRSDLPVEKRKTHHNIVVCDLNRSYKEYMK